jgi:hypothetical protein|eukprot:5766256-Prymnesium_polylepis.1
MLEQNDSIAAVALQLPGAVEFGRCHQLNKSWQHTLMGIHHLTPEQWWWTLWRARLQESLDEFPVLRSIFNPAYTTNVHDVTILPGLYSPLLCKMQIPAQKPSAICLDEYEFTVEIRSLPSEDGFSTFVWSASGPFEYSSSYEGLICRIGTMPDWIYWEDDRFFDFELSIKVSRTQGSETEYYWLQSNVQYEDGVHASSSVPLRQQYASELVQDFEVNSHIFSSDGPVQPFLNIQFQWWNEDGEWLEALELSEILFYLEKMAPWMSDE